MCLGLSWRPRTGSTLLRNLTIAGWLLLGGPIGFVAFQFDRVRRIGDQPFASVWDQRIEVLSFLMLPPNQVVLVPDDRRRRCGGLVGGRRTRRLADDTAASERSPGDHLTS